ncbi:hypothetical protein C8R45DRAFT_1111579 [Mycena sanguinolenta]|nr:hypothetical protein C8R45DRAFT_1111579 [Mycena sanguinolenta]
MHISALSPDARAHAIARYRVATRRSSGGEGLAGTSTTSISYLEHRLTIPLSNEITSTPHPHDAAPTSAQRLAEAGPRRRRPAPLAMLDSALRGRARGLRACGMEAGEGATCACLTKSGNGKNRHRLPGKAGQAHGWRKGFGGGCEEFKCGALGWIAYVLPDRSATYYVQPTLHATTDADLRDSRTLGSVSRALGGGAGYRGGRKQDAMELWLSDRECGDGTVRQIRLEDDNASASASVSPGKRRAKDWRLWAADNVGELEDHLDMEIRYWAFMELHVVLPPGAEKEAVDVLTWALTDPMPPQHKMSFASLFTQSECQRLLQLLRPFGGDIGNDQLHSPGLMRRTIDVLLSGLLLGVPYLVHTRAVYRMSDAERAIGERTSLPTLLIGMCTCLLAAVLLGASVTVLSLPGLQSIPRATALAVVLLAAGAIIVSVLALFQYEAELGDTVPVNAEVVGRKGSLVISTQCDHVAATSVVHWMVELNEDFEYTMTNIGSGATVYANAEAPGLGFHVQPIGLGDGGTLYVIKVLKQDRVWTRIEDTGISRATVALTPYGQPAGSGSQFWKMERLD